MATSCTVHVIDDDPRVLESLIELLRMSGRTAVGYGSALEFLNSAPHNSVCCIVSDIRMPGMDGLELLEELRARDWHAPVILITGHGDVTLAVRAMKCGASDFLEKPYASEAILRAVDEACARAAPGTHRQTEHRKALVARLSSREVTVLLCLVEGDSNKIIARKLGLSPRTVETHRAHIMQKLEAHSLSELVRIALSADLVRD